MLQVILEKTSAPALTKNSVDLTFRFDAAINMGFLRGKKIISIFNFDDYQDNLE